MLLLFILSCRIFTGALTVLGMVFVLLLTLSQKEMIKPLLWGWRCSLTL